LNAKLDLFRLRAIHLTRQEASALFAEIQRTLSIPDDPSGTGRTVHVTLPASLIGTHPQGDLCQTAELQRTISYTLRIKGCIKNPGIRSAAIDCI
jgi:hypothetical protein